VEIAHAEMPNAASWDEHMPVDRSYTEQVAETMLNRYGLAAIWDLHLAAARLAPERGRIAVAVAMIEIADAAEVEWLKRKAADLTTSPSA
jgi:hypothetical protein